MVSNPEIYAKQSRKLQKICEQKSYRQNKCPKFEFVLFYTTNLQKFLENNFFFVHFFQLFQPIWNQRKILRIFYIHMQKIRGSIFRGSLITYISISNIVKNIIWHLFASESHPVVKITLT
jgi:hypothetical protein